MDKVLLCILAGGCVAQVSAAGFLEDSKATLKMRNAYYNADYLEGSNDVREWGQAFRLDYLSGYTAGTIGVGIDLQGGLGIHLDGGRGHHPNNSTFSPSDSDGSSVGSWSSGGALIKARFSKTEIRYGNTFEPALPILKASDGRVTPQLFQGGMVTSKDFDSFTFVAGQFDKAKGRASTNRTGLSVPGATAESDDFTFAGVDWQATKNLTLQYYHARLEDFYNQDFWGLLHSFPIGDSQSFKTDLRYFKSDSTGANGTGGYRFNNNGGFAKSPGEVENVTWSAMFTYVLGGHQFTLGRQEVSDEGGFPYLNQGGLVNEGAGGSSFYLFTNQMAGSFVRAGEKTNFGQYLYDFAASGVPGLKASLTYLRGHQIKATSGVGHDLNEWERNVRLDYVIQSGTFKGLGGTVRYAQYHGSGTALQDQDQLRVFLNYSYSFF